MQLFELPHRPTSIKTRIKTTTSIIEAKISSGHFSQTYFH